MNKSKQKAMLVTDFNKQVLDFKDKRDSTIPRYASWDFCYEYFYHNQGKLGGVNLQTSCMQLWSYLASLGMIVRGNELQKNNYACLVDVVKYINVHQQYYQIHLSDNVYINDMMTLYNEFDNALNLQSQKNRKTLITKIMLGVYGCCPAFDSRFCKTFGLLTKGKLTVENLKKVQNFYFNNQKVIDIINIQTLSFGKQKKKHLKYPTAKLIDMYGFNKNSKIF